MVLRRTLESWVRAFRRIERLCLIMSQLRRGQFDLGGPGGSSSSNSEFHFSRGKVAVLLRFGGAHGRGSGETRCDSQAQDWHRGTPLED
eukprot:757011-Amphidinium_carterae.1